MKRSCCTVDNMAYNKAAKRASSTLNDSLQENLLIVREFEYTPEDEPIKFKIHCECVNECHSILVVIKRENVCKLSLCVADEHVQFRSIVRRHYAQLQKLVLSLNLPLGKTVLRVYVRMY